MENKSQTKKKTQLSVIIRDPNEKLNRSGINCIRYESSHVSQHLDRIFTAGRDSNIRSYTNLLDDSKSFAHQLSFASHTDWVNDIVLCPNTKTLFSASSDSTVKIWNASKGTLLSTLCNHKDYVKCLAFAKDKSLLASAGFDKNIFIWDVNTSLVVNPSGSLEYTNINDNKYSIYSLAMNNQGTLLAAGSPENCIRLWDPRTCNKLMKLKGHTHNIRAILLNDDGTQCLSASSDNTIRLWSIGQQRCISTIEVHSEGVWTLCANESFNKVYSAGKDSRVFFTDLRSQESILICEETAPVLSIDFGYNQQSLWISKTDSTIKNWSLTANNSNEDKSNSKALNNLVYKNNNNNHDTNSLSSSSSSFNNLQTPLNNKPLMTIKGTTNIKQYHVLNDKRYIVTKDSEENVCVWDVLQARIVESLGKENYENVIKVRQRFISIPNWFTIDLKLGVLTINLDESDCLSAWINFKDMDHNHIKQSQIIDLNDAKINYGCIFLESLFKNCLFLNPKQIQICQTLIHSNGSSTNSANNTNINETNGNKQETNPTNNNNNKGDADTEANRSGLLRFNIPDHIPIIISEVAGRIIHRFELRELNEDSETLNNSIPSWVIDAISGKIKPPFGRCIFVLLPYNQNQAKQVNKDRLSSIDLLQVKKLKEHVYTKLLKPDEINQIQQSESNSTNQKSETGSTNDTLINQSIELICSDQVLTDSEMSLRTIKHLVWKGTGDLTIFYNYKASNNFTSI